MDFLSDMGADIGASFGEDDRGADSESTLFDDIKAAEKVAYISGKDGGGGLAELDFGDMGDMGFNFVPRDTKKWSQQQLDIFELFKDPNSGHVTIIARAGSSKTTTSIEGGRHAPEENIMFCAFGRDIAAELSERIELLGRGNGVEAKTTHSMGCRFITRVRPSIKIDKNACYPRIDKALLQYFGRKENVWDEEAFEYCKLNAWHLEAIIGMVKMMKPYATKVQDFIDVALEMNLSSVPDSKLDRKNLPTIFQRLCEVSLLVLNNLIEEALRSKVIELPIDFNDMIFLPVRCGWVYPCYKLTIIDEAQDLCFTQIELATLACDGRIFIVGDDRQAIYGWRGADSGSIKRMTEYLGSKVMYLTTCYRCAKSIIREAQQYVPDIEAWDQSPEGEVHHVAVRKIHKLAKLGDFIISRTNAPLMSICLKLISQGKRAKMAGNDIGLEMMRIYETVEGKGKNCVPFVDKDDMWKRLIAWGIKAKEEMTDMLKRKYTGAKEEYVELQILKKTELIKDKLEIFQVMLNELKTPDLVKQRMMNLFEDEDDDGNMKQGKVKKINKVDRSKYILCTSVHKAKGLEAENAFVLADTLRTRDEEEINICYVAVTRPKLRLYYAYEKEDPAKKEEEYAKKINRRWHESAGNGGDSGNPDGDRGTGGDSHQEYVRQEQESRPKLVTQNQPVVRRGVASYDEDFLNQIDQERGRRY